MTRPAVCADPTCVCWRRLADYLTTDLTRHEHCLEQGWTHHSKETT
jgi:hypothetical protein